MGLFADGWLELRESALVIGGLAGNDGSSGLRGGSAFAELGAFGLPFPEATSAALSPGAVPFNCSSFRLIVVSRSSCLEDADAPVAGTRPLSMANDCGEASIP